LDKNTVAVAA